MLVMVTFRTATVTGNTDRVLPSTLGISLRLFLIDYADYADDADYAGDSHREYGQGTSIYFRNFMKTWFYF